MGMIVTLNGIRLTDGTEGRVSAIPRNPWHVTDGVGSISPGPQFFRINALGGLETLAGGPATLVATYDSSSTLTFTPQGASYMVMIDISGHKTRETWTIDGAGASVDWAMLGVKTGPADRIDYPYPLTPGAPLYTVDTTAELPGTSVPGVIYFVTSEDAWYGYTTGSGWTRVL